MPGIYRVILWAVIIGGLVPGFIYLATFRPYRRFSVTHIDASGWVPLIMVLYVIAAIDTALGINDGPQSWGEAIPGLLLGVAIDAALWLRLVRWHRFRRLYIPRTTDESESAES